MEAQQTSAKFKSKIFSCKNIIDYLKVNESTPDSLAEGLPDAQDEVLVGALHVAIPEHQ